MAVVVFLQEDEDVPSVYRNLKIFCETAPRKSSKAYLSSSERYLTLHIIRHRPFDENYDGI